MLQTALKRTLQNMIFATYTTKNQQLAFVSC